MMSLRSRGSRSRDEDRVLPLINVVFLLLIFFMLAGGFKMKDPFELKPPQSISDASDDPNLMIVLFGENGEVAIDGDIVAMDDLDHLIGKRLSTDPPDGVRIKAHGATSAPDVIALFAHFGDAGIEDLRLMTVAKKH